MRWQRLSTLNEEKSDDKEFYENRSVGHGTVESSKKHLKAIASDIHVDYKNVSRIPIEIERLTDDRLTLKGIEVKSDFFLQFYSKPSMLQRLQVLMACDKNFQRHHFQLFDVMLLKFQQPKAPELFTKQINKKVLPTPLCFRDFHDYMMMPGLKSPARKSMDENNISHDGDKRALSEYKPEDFILETSLKRKLLQSEAHKSAESSTEMKATEKRDDDKENMEVR